MMGSSRRPISVKKTGKALGEPRWDSRNRFLGNPHQNGENRTQDGHFKRQFENMEVFWIFPLLNQDYHILCLISAKGLIYYYLTIDGRFHIHKNLTSRTSFLLGKQ